MTGLDAVSVSRVLMIRNRKGLHARASAKFVQCVEGFDAEVWVSREGQTVGGTSIMGLMMLAAGPGSEIAVAAAGVDADAVLDAIEALVGSGFGEDCEGA
jgi:phosphocarrier protein HPr